MVDPYEGSTADEFTVKVVVEALWQPINLLLELFQSVDEVLGVGGFYAIDPGVTSIHVKKEKNVLETP